MVPERLRSKRRTFLRLTISECDMRRKHDLSSLSSSSYKRRRRAYSPFSVTQKTRWLAAYTRRIACGSSISTASPRKPARKLGRSLPRRFIKSSTSRVTALAMITSLGSFWPGSSLISISTRPPPVHDASIRNRQQKHQSFSTGGGNRRISGLRCAAPLSCPCDFHASQSML